MDTVLQDMKAESYVGTTLWSSKGQPIGLIAIIGRKPMADTKLATSILQLAAVRASGELERRQSEEALRESEQQLRLTYQAAKIGTFEWNVQTGVNVWSPELEAMYGLACGEFGKTQPAWEQLVHPEDRAAAVGLVNQAFKTGEPVEGEWRVVWRDGSVHWISGRFQSFKDAAGKLLRLSGVNMDITERKKQEEELHKFNRVLKALNDSSQAMVRATDETDYLREVCRIIDKDCGYAMVWIGYAEDDEAKSVRPVVYAGFEEGYLETLKAHLGGHRTRTRSHGLGHPHGQSVYVQEYADRPRL